MSRTTNDISGKKAFIRKDIESAYMHLAAPSRSFDYSDVRVQTSAPSSAPIPAGVYLEDCTIIRVIGQLRPHEQAWLRYCYAVRSTEKEWEDIETVAQWLWKEHLSTLDAEGKKMSPERQERLYGFILPALQQIQAEAKRGQRLYRIQKLLDLTANTTGATKGCWKRDWHPHWNGLCGILRKLDHDALVLAIGAFTNDEKRKAANTEKRIYA